MAAVPGGTDLHAKRIFLWVARINVCSGGSYSKLSEFGWRASVSGFVVQMYTALIATLEREFLWRIRERSPRGPPRASLALLSSPHTELIMWVVQASVPTSSSVSQVRILAISFRSPGYKKGT